MNIFDFQAKEFTKRHIGPNEEETAEMLVTIGSKSIEALINNTVPTAIRMDKILDLPVAMSEHEYLQHIKNISLKNKTFKNYIGQGYYDTITPSVILRNIFESPGWYTQYTPYQAEIAQGRLESLLNFQTMICDLTGLPVANASLLDEATAAALPKLLPNHGEEFLVDERLRTLWDRDWVLYALVGLLSVEWLTRKLLKLA